MSAPADQDASQLYYSCFIASEGGRGGGGIRGRLGCLQGGRGVGGNWMGRGEWGVGGVREGGMVQIWYAVYTMQLGSSRHPRALRVRSTKQLTYNCDQMYDEVIRN